MKIRMKVCMVGGDFTRNPGDEIELPDAQAARLIAADYAEAVTPPPANKKKGKVQKATEPQDHETPEQ